MRYLDNVIEAEYCLCLGYDLFKVQPMELYAFGRLQLGDVSVSGKLAVTFGMLHGILYHINQFWLSLCMSL